jgi:hypothetical protein
MRSQSSYRSIRIGGEPSEETIFVDNTIAYSAAMKRDAFRLDLLDPGVTQGAYRVDPGDPGGARKGARFAPLEGAARSSAWRAS